MRLLKIVFTVVSIGGIAWFAENANTSTRPLEALSALLIGGVGAWLYWPREAPARVRLVRSAMRVIDYRDVPLSPLARLQIAHARVKCGNVDPRPLDAIMLEREVQHG
jgi:ABC-type nickel/cobalt efflux system permease component RcnA